MFSPKIPSRPLARIALALSGGGYRAASFHLGSMAYLHHLPFKEQPLLHNVRIISTVSGGTITGVLYAMMVQQGKPFPEVYRRLFLLLNEFDLVEEAMERLRNTDQWPADKRVNLINAFAQIYNDRYTEQQTFAVFKNMDASHLKEVVFNATDFDHGLAFRFQNDGLMGSMRFRVPNDARWEVKLGDVIAASSCFPGGFEPIAFPDDFLYPEARALRTLKQTPIFGEALGLMDGGIYDNQGVGSILWSDRRHLSREEEEAGEHYYDLMVISDVTSPYMEDFKFHPVPEGNKGWRRWNYQLMTRTAGRINRGLLLFHAALLLVAALFLVLGKLDNNWLTGVGFTLLAFPVIFFLLFTWSKRRVLKTLSEIANRVLSRISPFYLERVGKLDFTHYTLGQLEPPLMDRVFSVFTMVNDVFLKQVRRLVYRQIYTDETWRYRRIANLIRELTAYDFGDKVKSGLLWDSRARKAPPGCDELFVTDRDDVEGSVQKVLGEKITRVAEEASSFGTTLWFTPRDQMEGKLKALLATGQFTMCYNLLIYLNSLMHEPGNGFDELEETEKEAVRRLYDQARTDWLAFKEDPYFLVNKYEKA